MKKNVLLIVLLLVLFPLQAAAQGDGYEKIIADAVAETAENCGAVGANEICYGHALVSPMVNQAVVPEFDTAGEVLPIDAMCRVELGGLTPTGDWGLAVMKVQPDPAIPALTYVLFGAGQLQNAASVRSQIAAKVISATDIYSGPSLQHSVLGSLEADAEVMVNACNSTRHWFRLILEDGRVGWLPLVNLSILGDVQTLPVADPTTPIYASMQAFSLYNGHLPADAVGSAPQDGMLIQAPAGAENVPLRINSLDMKLAGTAYLRAELDGEMRVTVLAGSATLTANGFTAIVPAGAYATMPILADGTLPSLMRVALATEADFAHLPLGLLPEAVDPRAALGGDVPMVVGLEKCTVISRSGPSICALHFLNPDGDPIEKMEVEFVSAPEGQWTGSLTDQPVLLDGDHTAGRLAWKVTCDSGEGCFIGPVIWSITIIDAAGHASAPFEAAFNCVSG